ncbi:MAG: TCP-1/cpn60 chaperonin family protein [Nanoarchaeota archaeon]|nr:TCP-1/cpn60 chaperonin family protein [Nanoarchaeota archaeon]MBU1644313.1 TCP-1/cpn60 chaperonin family protein [Nanoarchaeota archaeon]MBU1976360.1 TCP-1/cpn60 chaperonin family protein [Nanoarchaeota archaeon]
MPENTIQPIFIMPEDTKRTTGRDAQHNNIAAAKAVANTVRTTLGPKGMDKMIVDSIGDVIITNDGVTILEEMEIEHPAAKMIVEVAKTQEDIVGDGTTTAVVLAGELLKKAEDLLDQNIHPTVLARGYRLADSEAQKILNRAAKSVTVNDESILKNIAVTAMTGKGAEKNKNKLAELIVVSVKRVFDGKKIDLEDIKVQTIVGESADTSELIEGIVLDKEKVHPSMPEKVENAVIALLDSSLEIKNTEIDAKIQITDPSQLNSFLEQEERTLRQMVEKITSTGANVLFCQKGIDDIAQHFLAKSGVLAVRRVKKSDMEKLARATGAKVVSSWKELSVEDLGSAGLVREEKISDEEMIFVENCKNPKAVTLMVRGGTEHVVEEIKRAVTDALGDLAAALKYGFVVSGAGAVEMEVAKGLKRYAAGLQGREQLAVQAFAEAMEVIPKTLAENAGLDPINVLTQLRAAHDNGNDDAGINVFTGEIMNAWENGVIEPLKVKTLALSSAAEVAEMILRIDDVILGGQKKTPSGMPLGGPPGMGGM